MNSGVSEPPGRPAGPGRDLLVGLALVSMSLLILEITTTRILSVAMAYHFAVLSISLAMMGLAIGGVVVHAASSLVSRRGASALASHATLLFAVATFVALFVLLGLPLQPLPNFAGLMNLTLLFVPQAVPYVLAGIATALLLSAYPGSANRVYAADLLGASAGCLAVTVCLPRVGGPATILLGGALAAVGSAFLASAARVEGGSPPRRAWAWALVLGAVAAVGCLTSLFEIRFVKGEPEPRPDRIVWTAHSRLSFSREQESPMPFGWGLGSAFVPRDAPYRFRRIRIDGLAETPILRWAAGDPGVEHVLWDVTSLPYHLKPGGRAMVIGSGGGRDILTAKLSGAWSVDAVEINEGIVREMLGTFAGYSGGVYSLPGVTATALDGRSAIQRAKDASYEVIQMSAVDTWAAGSSGVLALMENGLYTVEAFAAALRKLRPDGYLAVSRFKYAEDAHGEIVRMTALGVEALRRTGPAGADIGSRILLVANVTRGKFYVVTMLVRPTPFSPEEIERARETARRRGFSVEWPREGSGPASGPAVQLLQARTAAEREEFFEAYPIDVRPTWDDRPYFFHQTRLSSLRNLTGELDPGSALRLVPMLTIFRLAVFLLVISLAVVAWPAASPSPEAARPLPWARLLFFGAIGFGFMLYEIPLVQKLTLGLGHPTHALSVVLFGLLVGTGVGSFLSGLVPTRLLRAAQVAGAVLASGVGVSLAAVGGSLLELLFGLGPVPRFALAAAVVLSTGLILGTALPLGIRRLSAEREEWSIPWCWATNGAASVLASVGALIVGIEAGMRATFLLGAGAYLVAAAAAAVTAFASPAPDS